MYPRTLCFATVTALALALACESGPSKPALPADDVPAGRVVELVGVAHVTDAQGQRQLALDDVVTGADVIETGADSYIQIDLFHNGVSWGMGPKRKRRVNESLAWAATRGSGTSFLGDKVGPDRTLAAGRHAERSAADTRATAIALTDKRDQVSDDGDRGTLRTKTKRTAVPKVEVVDKNFAGPEVLVERASDSGGAGSEPPEGPQPAITSSGGLKKQRNPIEGESSGTMESTPAPVVPSGDPGLKTTRNLSVQMATGIHGKSTISRENGQPQPKSGMFRIQAPAKPRDERPEDNKKPESEKPAEEKDGTKRDDDGHADVAKIATRVESGEVPRGAMKAIESQLKRQLLNASRCELEPTVVEVRMELDKTGKLLSVSPNSEAEAVRNCLGQVANAWKIRVRLADKVVIRATLTWK